MKRILGILFLLLALTTAALAETTVLSIPSNVIAIEEEAFMNDASITAIMLPDDLVSIGTRAFNGCVRLVSVEIPDGASVIGDAAFANCFALREVSLPASISSIGSNAFDNCPNLTLIVTEGSPAEAYCINNGLNYEYSHLEPEPEENFITEDLPDGTVRIRWYTGSSPNVVVPATLGGKTVTDIGLSCFQRMDGPISISLPNGITSIGEYAFAENANLVSVNIPDSVATIGNGAFHSCTSLTQVGLPSGLTVINDYMFGECRSLTSIDIPEGVTTIGEGAFLNCTALTEVFFPSTLQTIGEFAFQDCISLTTVEIPESVTEIQAYAFSFCRNLTAARIPANVTTIGDSAFSGVPSDFVATVQAGSYAMRYCFNKRLNCEILGSYSDPEEDFTCDLLDDGSVAITGYIGSSAYVFIPAEMDGKPVSTIGDSAFQSDIRLQRVFIPEGVAVIGAAAFSDCSNMTQVVLPTSLRRIDSAAFSWCSELRDLVLPSGVAEIGDYAFDSCYNLTLTVTTGSYAETYCADNGLDYVSVKPLEPEESFSFKMLDDGTVRITNYTGSSVDLVIPSTIGGNAVSEIGSEALAFNQTLASLTLPPTVRVIRENAFYHCSNLAEIDFAKGLVEIETCAFYECAGLTELTLPDSLSIIGGRAFAYGGHLSSVNLPENVTSIGLEAFAGGADDFTATVHEGSYCEQYCVDNHVNYVLYIKPAWMDFDAAPFYPGGPIFINWYKGSDADVIVPAEYDGKPVYGISGGTFMDFSFLRSVVISEGISDMSGGAFMNCVNLVSATLPASLNSIDDNAFEYCPNVVFTVPADSYAQQYCIRNNLPYVLTE